MKREYYSDSITTFLNAKPNEILGLLARSNDFALEQTQRDAWLEEIGSSGFSVGENSGIEEAFTHREGASDARHRVVPTLVGLAGALDRGARGVERAGATRGCVDGPSPEAAVGVPRMRRGAAAGRSRRGTRVAALGQLPVPDVSSPPAP